MNKDTSIWNELNKLPRSEVQERSSWQNIENKMRNTNNKKSLITIVVTVAVLCLLMVLIGINQNETLPIQTAHDHGELKEIYFVRNSDFDEKKVIPSTLFTNVIAIQDPILVENFDKYMNLKVPLQIENPTPYINDPIIIELLFKYDNGKIEHYKMIDEETFYNMDTKQWYYIDSGLAHNDYRYAVYSTFAFSPSSWHAIFFLALVILKAICESIIKRKYGLKKIKYIENNIVAKYIHYGLVISMCIIALLIVRYKMIIHIFLVLLIFLIIGLSIIFLEKKYGSSKASYYGMIISIVFLIGVLTNLLIMR